jgi:hypothetical protein
VLLVLDGIQTCKCGLLEGGLKKVVEVTLKERGENGGDDA